MKRRTIIENILSNWSSLVITVVIAFVTSPILVHSLGNELYGIWCLIVSVTGYFTVLDFGVNTAIVRYISSSNAQNDHGQSRRVYSTSLAIFGIVACVLMIFSVVFGLFFQDIFKLFHFSRFYLFSVFLLSAIDLSLGLLFSVFLGCLTGLQEFKFINGSSILVNIIRSIALVYFLKHGFTLLMVALVQLGATCARSAWQYWRLKSNYHSLRFSKDSISRDTVRLIYSYSAYSFVIAIALKLLFSTDSVVIGTLLGASQVTFYAIPFTLVDYLEKFVWSMVAVLVPVISANEATGQNETNRHLYVTGTRYCLIFSMPVIISLYFYGGDFIRLWMGQEIASRSQGVLRIILIGYGLANSQLVSHGILKGISRHKVLAYILAIEALANLGLSVVLAKWYGIEGVALGTAIPLIAAASAIIAYTCHVLQLNVSTYLLRSYSGAAAGLLACVLFLQYYDSPAHDYIQVCLKGAMVTILFLVFALPISLYEERSVTFLKWVRRTLFLKSNL